MCLSGELSGILLCIIASPPITPQIYTKLITVIPMVIHKQFINEHNIT
jgi:hypothetical protein